MEENNLPDNE